MLRSNFEKVVQDTINKEDVDLDLKVADEFKDFIHYVENDLDNEINKIFDRLKSKISDMDSEFKLNLGSNRDRILNQVKENILKS